MVAGAGVLTGVVVLGWVAHQVAHRVAADFVKAQLRKREDWLKAVAGGAWSLKLEINAAHEERKNVVANLVALQQEVRSLKAQLDAGDTAADEAFQNIGQDMDALATERGKDRETLDALAVMVRQQAHAIAVLKEDSHLLATKLYHVNESLASKKPAPRKRAR